MYRSDDKDKAVAVATFQYFGEKSNGRFGVENPLLSSEVGQIFGFFPSSHRRPNN